MARRNNQELAFPALSIEGGLLAPDFLNKVAHLEASEQTEADYDIPRGLKLRDEIGRYWKIAQNLWQDFAAKRARTDLNSHALTVKELLEPLLRHVFCFGDLKAVGQVTLGERVFPIGFAAGEGKIPVVLAAHDQLLDKPDTSFGDGVRRRSPFLLAQEYLNASDDALWAVVGNGLKLRILRDNPSLTRPAYIEADLEAIFSEGLYPDFTALWLLAHASRFGKVGTEPANCPLERWRNTAQEDGIRARDRLRIGVTEALRALGTGFLAHPANTELRRRLEAGELTTQAYFEQLLRLIYRFIFLATIEDRELVFVPEATADAKARYLAGYSLTRLRQLSARRRSYDRHADLWQALTITFGGLGKGQPALGLPALGGLFAASQCPDLDAAQLDNSSLLSSLFSLCFFRDGAALSRVNYRDMDSEELGSVYESLLELIPEIVAASAKWSFRFAGDQTNEQGSARKFSGSFYTKDVLVQELLDSTLEPLIEKAIADNPSEPVDALLTLMVCDPACGSGHFLLGAARHIADRIAKLTAVDGNLLPGNYRKALRDVISHCVYGVDKNSLAVELAKTALWLEAYCPDRPLSFLDHRIRTGDAVIGILETGGLELAVDDSAFVAQYGDDDVVVEKLKKTNREARTSVIQNIERDSKVYSFDFSNQSCGRNFDALPEETIEQVQDKARAFEACKAELRTSPIKLASDMVVASYFAKKSLDTAELVPTTADIWRVLHGQPARPGVLAFTEQIVARVNPFHWKLGFPEVFSRGGFDLVLGNPPWASMSPDLKRFFAPIAPEVRFLPKDEQAALMERLLEDSPTNQSWQAYCRDLYSQATFIKKSGRYSMFAPGNLGKGDFNIYRMLVETAFEITRSGGYVSQLVPENFYNGANAAEIRKRFFKNASLLSLYGFENRQHVWFDDVHTRAKFCLYVAQKKGTTTQFNALFNITSEEKLRNAKLAQMVVPVSLVEEFSPDAIAVMEFAGEKDAAICRKMYERFPKFGEELEGQPYRHYMREMDMGNDRDEFASDPSGFPLFEGRMIDAFDYRAKGYVSGRGRAAVWEPYDFGSESKRIKPQWHIGSSNIPAKLIGRLSSYRIGFCDVASPTNERSLTAALVPPSTVCGHKVPTITFDNGRCSDYLLWLAIANSLVMDFIVRKKVALTMSLTIMDSLPFPRDLPEELRHSLCRRALLLTCAGPEMKGFFEQYTKEDPGHGFDLTAANCFETRPKIKAELDTLVAAKVYGLTKDEMRFILDPKEIEGQDCEIETFRVLKNNEMREFGEYSTRRLVLEAWDRLVA
ncbi:SAM-dependent DNA methyltransferase [Dechloromonas sp. H13]|uniref:Eco57I restriction-modification methylase domain-containing protein n=1 Tax=Dechloromonas sp. H13 TaxID=2570193 RepID=UPI0012913DF3|nr:SAM-dependent DNA methyltransferase [Dechloromonas sp. H13]